MDSVREITNALARPFRGDDLEWRISRAGVNRRGEPFAIVVPYVTARAIMERLDQVVGAENWQTAMEPTGPMGTKGAAGMSCGIGIRFPVNTVQSNDWVWKWDVAQATDIEPVKGAGSGAIKRAAVHWGMGRDLYGVGDLFAQVWTERGKAPKGANYAKPKVKIQGKEEHVEIWWLPPDLPELEPKVASSSNAKAATEGAVKTLSGERDAGSTPAEATPASERPGVDALEAAAKDAVERHGGPTLKQADLLAKLLRSSVFTQDERQRYAIWLRHTSTRENIGERIEQAQVELKNRKGRKSA